MHMKENDIRPNYLFDEYLKYCKEDIKKYFKKNIIKVNCPICNSKKIHEKFTKNNFTYNWCLQCQTLYVSPLPSEDNFKKYYTEAKSVRFWATDFYKHTEKKRKEKIFKPRIKLIKKIFINEINHNIDTLIDIGAGYGSFCEIAMQDCFFKNIIAIEPSPYFIKILKEKNIFVIEKFMEEVIIDDFKNMNKEGIKLFCAFEIWEHLYSPQHFLQSIKNVMNKGDYLLITTLNILGFDLLMLWDKSKSIQPPHHINIPNLKSLIFILESYGFKIEKAFTSGKLDVDIVKNMKISFNNHLCNYIINDSDDIFREKLQNFITKNNISSHMMIIAKLK